MSKGRSIIITLAVVVAAVIPCRTAAATEPRPPDAVAQQSDPNLHRIENWLEELPPPLQEKVRRIVRNDIQAAKGAGDVTGSSQVTLDMDSLYRLCQKGLEIEDLVGLSDIGLNGSDLRRLSGTPFTDANDLRRWAEAWANAKARDRRYFEGLSEERLLQEKNRAEQIKSQVQQWLLDQPLWAQEVLPDPDGFSYFGEWDTNDWLRWYQQQHRQLLQARQQQVQRTSGSSERGSDTAAKQRRNKQRLKIFLIAVVALTLGSRLLPRKRAKQAKVSHKDGGRAEAEQEKTN